MGYLGWWVLSVPIFKRIERGFYVVREHSCDNSTVFEVKGLQFIDTVLDTNKGHDTDKETKSITIS